jgi:hypothetical protein
VGRSNPANGNHKYARSTRGYGSKGMSARFGEAFQRARRETSRWRSHERLVALLTVTALIGGGLLIISEFLHLFEIEADGLVVKQQAGGPHHAYAMLVLGGATIGAALLVRSTALWPPALGVALLGGFALVLALVGDLPDATRSDLVRGARIADAHPTLGFWTELAGAAIALVSGVGLVLLLRRTPTAAARSPTPER